MTAPADDDSLSAPPDEDALGRIEQQLSELTDLFRRRLLDDRDKRRLIDAATERAKDAETGPFRQYLHPLVVGVALVVDRLDAYAGDDPHFVASVREELLDALARHGVVPIDAAGAIDPRLHDVVAVDGPRPERSDQRMVVSRVQSRGYRHGDWIFRPARVTAVLPAED